MNATTDHYGEALPEGRWTHNAEALLQHFLATQTVQEPGAEMPARWLRTGYELWAAAHGEQTVTRTQFGLQIKKAGIAKRQRGGQIFYVDIAPRTEENS